MQIIIFKKERKEDSHFPMEEAFLSDLMSFTHIIHVPPWKMAWKLLVIGRVYLIIRYSITWNNKSNPRRPTGAAGNRLFV